MVQLALPGGQGLVDRVADQRVHEAQRVVRPQTPRRGPAPASAAAVGRLVEPGQGGDVGEPAAVAEDRHRAGRPRCSRPAAGRGASGPCSTRLATRSRSPCRRATRRVARPRPAARAAAGAAAAGCRRSCGGRRRRTGRARRRRGGRAPAASVASGASGPGCTCTVAVVLGQLGEQCLVVVRLAGAQGRGDEHRQSLQPAQQEGERAQRAGVAPLHVVDGEDHRLLLGARLTVSQYRPCSTANDPSARSAGSAAGDLAEHRRGRGRRRRASSSTRRVGSARVPSNSWRTAPKPKSRSSWLPRAVSTRAPSASASRRRTSCSSRLLPMPAGPWISASRPWPSTASARAPRSTRTSRSRSTRSARPAGRACVRRGRPAGAGTPGGRACRRSEPLCGPGRPATATGRAPRASSERSAGPGSTPELVGQRGAGPAQRGQRVGLPVRPVEREHQQPPALLAQRVLGDESLDLGHQHGGLALAQPCLEQLLAGDLAQAGQPGDLAVRPGSRRRGRRTPGRARARSASSSSRCARSAGSALPAWRSRRSNRQASTRSRPRPAARSRGPAGRSRSAGRAGPRSGSIRLRRCET